MNTNSQSDSKTNFNTPSPAGEGRGGVEYIDLGLVCKSIWENRKKFYIILPATFLLTCAFVLCLPRYYTSEVKLVPEMGGTDMGSTLGDLASSFGIDLSSGQSADAISPLLYPDLMEDNGFVAKIFNIRVKSDFDEDMPIDTTYYAYMRWFQKKTPWEPVFEGIKRMFTTKPVEGVRSDDPEYDPYHISRIDYGLMEKVRDDIAFNIDKKTAVITLSVKAQDPLICRQLADSIKNQLQAFITDYRTSKARVDLEHYQALTDKAHEEYLKAVAEYSKHVDSGRNPVLQSAKSKIDELENEMQIKFSAYQTMQTQLQATQAKVQERTPAFTLLKGASVAVKPAGPKRMIIVAVMTLLAFLVTSVWCYIKKPTPALPTGEGA